MPVIYVDVLIATNMIIDYLLLRAASLIVYGGAQPVRLLAASILGGMYSLTVIAPMGPGTSAAAAMTAFFLMVFSAFGFSSIVSFLKRCAAFLGVNILFGGMMFFILCRLLPERVIYKNGSVYFDVNILTLVIGAAVCYGLMTVGSLLLRRRTPRGSVFPIRLTGNGRSVEGRALYDTGNSLRDRFSQKPVIIVRPGFVGSICPEGFTGALDSTQSEMCEGFRLIPFSTLGRDGLMPAFTAEKGELYDAGEWKSLGAVIVAVSGTDFAGGEYDSLIGTPAFELLKDEVK